MSAARFGVPPGEVVTAWLLYERQNRAARVAYELEKQQIRVREVRWQAKQLRQERWQAKQGRQGHATDVLTSSVEPETSGPG